MADCSRLAGEHEQRGAGCDQLELQATSLLIQTLKKKQKKNNLLSAFYAKHFGRRRRPRLSRLLAGEDRGREKSLVVLSYVAAFKVLQH